MMILWSWSREAQRQALGSWCPQSGSRSSGRRPAQGLSSCVTLAKSMTSLESSSTSKAMHKMIYPTLSYSIMPSPSTWRKETQKSLKVSTTYGRLFLMKEFSSNLKKKLNRWKLLYLKIRNQSPRRLWKKRAEVTKCLIPAVQYDLRMLRNQSLQIMLSW